MFMWLVCLFRGHLWDHSKQPAHFRVRHGGARKYFRARSRWICLRCGETIEEYE